MFPAPDAGKEVKDFLWAQNNGQGLGLLRNWKNVFKAPVLLQGDPIEEAKGQDRDHDRNWG
jgi:hypothetical protein